MSTQATLEVTQIDVGQIIPNPNNARKTMTGIAALAESLKLIGLVEPIVVRELPVQKGDVVRRYVIVAGHRRYAAALLAGWSDIVAIVTALDDVGAELNSLGENTSREDLTPEDLADAVGRLVGLEITDEEIARALSIDDVDVQRAKLVGTASKATRKKARANGVDRQLTLEEHAALVKYSDDDGALEMIRSTIENRPSQLAHTIARVDAELAHDAKVAAFKESLGVPIIEVDHYDGPPAKTCEPLANLTTAENKKLTAANHKDCPGHVASIENADRWATGKLKAVYYCLDWKANSHKRLAKLVVTYWGRDRKATSGTSKETVSDKEKAKKTAERRAIIANNKAWRPAVEVRLMWIDEVLLAKKSVDAAAKLWILQEINQGHDTLKRGDNAGATIEGAFMVALAQLVDFREDELKVCGWRPNPHHNADRLSRYFKFLESQGYVCSDVELIVYAGVKKTK